MEFVRTELSAIRPKEFQLLVQATEDRLFGVQHLGLQGLGADGCLPEDIRCSDPETGEVGPSSMPGYRQIINRAILRTVSQVENRVKLALYPRRKTDYARTPREVYEDRVRYGSGSWDSFLTPASREFPTWGDLTPEQQDQYGNDQSLYTDGTLPWDLLTPDQKDLFSRSVVFVPNKVDQAERIDGRNRSYIKLYERYVRKIHRLELNIQDPAGLGIPYLARSYSENEYRLYRKEGGVMLFPAQARLSAFGTANMLGSTSYGMVVPNLPQILQVDYEFGLDEIPHDLQDAIALLAAVKIMEMVNIAFTKGMGSFSVQGFSAAFGEGLYQPVIQRYTEEAEKLMSSYYQLAMIGW